MTMPERVLVLILSEGDEADYSIKDKFICAKHHCFVKKNTNKGKYFGLIKLQHTWLVKTNAHSLIQSVSHPHQPTNKHKSARAKHNTEKRNEQR